MKAITKLLIAICTGGVLTLSSCLDETFPTNGATAEQLQQNSTALDAAAGGIPSFMKTLHVWRDQASDFAYPAQMIIRDVMGQDMIQVYNNYQHFYSYQQISVAINEDYLLNQIIWYYYNLQVQAANSIIGVVDPETASDEARKFLGQALAYRAFIYLDMARLYEYLPNHKNSPINKHGNDVSGLTVPITDPRHPVDPQNNPRATHEEMFKFILADLDEAQSYFEVNDARGNDLTRPNLSVVYGLKARLYMWDENYPKAAEFAKLAQAGYTPLTAAQWNDATNGFNNMTSQTSWMFAINQSKEDDCVQSYSNWTSFMCSESAIGYAGRYNNPMVCDKSLYEQIDNRDFRKLSWKAPKGSALSGQEVFSYPAKSASLMELASLKFRPGNGVVNNSDVTWATAIPLMRVEEMYLIEAEAVAQTNPSQGKQLLNTFMRNYRFKQYNCTATTQEGIIDEIFLQKRIELWGEGIICFDFKRLNKSVTRAYTGTNWPETAQFNTQGRPAWYNFVMCGYESDLNEGCRNKNNPDVGGTYQPES